MRLPDGYVRALAAGSGGALWIGTSSNGLARYDPVTNRFHTWRPDQTLRTGPRSAEINALLRLQRRPVTDRR